MPDRTPEHEKLLTPAEVSALFRVDPKSVTRWAKAGKLASIRTLGGHRRYYESEIRALLAPVPETAPDPLRAPIRTLWGDAPSRHGAAVRDRLQASGITTVGTLTVLTADELKADYGLKPPQVDEVRRVLYRKGLTLKGEVIGKVA